MADSEQLLNELLLIPLGELADCSGFTIIEIRELVTLGVFELHDSTGEWMFEARCIELARAAHRLRDDFELSLNGLALVLAYRERIGELERRLHMLECQLPQQH
ncbi:MAG: hypothetical protein HY308_06785 [Gammaproteobacteria bacterium]|nr:hypothetical protein [Gammaproteobacteria bacterium]